MCGRFTYLFTWKEIHDRLQAFVDAIDEIGQGVAEQPPRYNIAPTQPIATLYQTLDGEPAFRADLMRWGLVPIWVKDPSTFSLIINARVETIREKPSFRGGLRHHRCLIPASGYYEWMKLPNGKKQPFYITNADGGPMWFAGIYSTWLGPDGSEIDTNAIITLPASPDLSPLHDRIPATIPDALVRDWLDVRGVNERKAHEMLVPPDPGTMAFHPVSNRVNSIRNDGPALIEPVEDFVPVKPKKASGQGELF